MILAATRSLEQAAALPWDAVVIGAGPAGAVAACGLARAGVKVLLVDRAAFPRYKVCGCCLNLRGLAALESIGLGELIDKQGAVSLRQVHLAAAGRQARVPLPGGSALSRERFDAALVDAALAAGAVFMPRTVAAASALRSDARELLLRQEGRSVSIQTRLLIAADGLGGRLLADEAGFAPNTTGASRIGAGAVAATAPDFYGPGTIFMACGRAGYVGLVRLEENRLDIAAALDRSLIHRAGGLGYAAEIILKEAGFPIVPGLAALPWRGTPLLTQRPRKVAAHRVFALGDAAGYVEPFSGEGMTWAIAAAVALVPLAVRACQSWEPALARGWNSLYHQTIARRQRACRAVAQVLRHPLVTQCAIGLLSYLPRLAAPLVRYFNTVSPPRKNHTYEPRHRWPGNGLAIEPHHARGSRRGRQARLL